MNRKIIGLSLMIMAFTISSQAQSINWISLSQAQKLAPQSNKKVMIFAEAKWCGYCKKMYREVFPQQSVQDSLQKYFHPVRLDIESDQKVIFNGNDYTERGLARRFRVSSTPTTIFLDASGNILGAQPGYLPAKIFDKLLTYVGADLMDTGSFRSYLKKHNVEL